MANEPAVRPSEVMLTFEQAKEFVKAAIISGMVDSLKNPEDGLVRIQFGKELGFGPATSLTAIYSANGRAALQANTMAALIKRSRPRYDYRTIKRTSEEAVIEFSQDGKPQGEATFSIHEARLAGLLPAKPGSGWAKYPKAMLWARALSQGFRMFCGDLALAGNVYLPEELDIDGPTEGSVPVVTYRNVAKTEAEQTEAVRKPPVGPKLVELEAEFKAAFEAAAAVSTPGETLAAGRSNLEGGLAELNQYRMDGPR